MVQYCGVIHDDCYYLSALNKIMNNRTDKRQKLFSIFNVSKKQKVTNKNSNDSDINIVSP